MTQDEMTALECGAERIAGMNLGATALSGISKEGLAEARANAKDLFAHKPKKRRSDAGKPRIKPAEAAPGALPEAARAHLDKLRLAITEKWRLAKIAESELQEAESEWYRYLDRLSTAGRDSITAK